MKPRLFVAADPLNVQNVDSYMEFLRLVATSIQKMDTNMRNSKWAIFITYLLFDPKLQKIKNSEKNSFYTYNGCDGNDFNSDKSACVDFETDLPGKWRVRKTGMWWE